MSEIQKNMTEQRAEDIMSSVLRWGIIFTSIVVLCGAIIFLGEQGTEIPDYKYFNGDQSKFNNLSGILDEAKALNGLGLIQLGLLLLIFVPIARVALSIFTFAMQKDYIYVAFSFIVLTVLVYSYVSSAL